MGLFDKLQGMFASGKGWQRVAPPGQGCSFELPAMPEIDGPDPHQPPYLLRTTARIRCTSPDGSTRFGVDVVELGFSPDDEPGGAAAVLREAFPPDQGSELSDRSLDGHPGYLEKAGDLRRACYAVGERCYLLTAGPGSPSFREADALRFLDSFTLEGSPLRRARVRFLTLLVTVPPGWDAKSSEQGDLLVLESRQIYPVNGLDKRDGFTVTVMKADGHSLEEMATQLIAEVTSAGATEAAGQGGVRLEEGAASVIDLAGVPAVVHRAKSTVTVGGKPFEYEGPRVFVVHADILYVVAARYSVERAAEVAPIAEEVVANLRFHGS